MADEPFHDLDDPGLVAIRSNGKAAAKPSFSSTGVTENHRGELLLILGLVGLLCCPFFGVAAWQMSRKDLSKMRKGMMNRDGRGLTLAGNITGLIATIISTLTIILAIMAVLIRAVMSVTR